MKRIVICCDGTWNFPDQEGADGIPCPTNVVKVACAVAPAGEDEMDQLLYYDPGVGTAGGPLKRRFEGATGKGLADNLREAYAYLVQNYELGDELFFFGFSRGAFTVRSLTGFIRKCGILRRSAGSVLDEAFDFYRARERATHPRSREAVLFRKTYAVADRVPIRFVGVWDTVGALGNPLLLNGGILGRRNRFHDTDLSTHIEHAYQALAVDEQRIHFEATLWHRQKDAPESQALEQVWFAGVHSDIGGGYAEAGLSDISLRWMVDKARRLNLGLTGIEPPPAPDASQEPHESRKGLYKFTPVNNREIDLPPEGKVTNESIHPSVMAKWQGDPTYRPPSLEDYFRRHPEKRPGQKKNQAAASLVGSKR